MRGYSPPDARLWAGRHDTLPNERVFQHVSCVNLLKHAVSDIPDGPVIAGFCTDEGIARNEGRTGAADAPDILRQQFGKLAWHSGRTFTDIGNIRCENHDLEGAAETFATLISEVQAHGHHTVVFGGGHEIAHAHYRGLATRFPRLGIVNFDAHFDLRPVTPERGATSGTPFRQIADFCKSQNRPFHYACIGIQPHANTRSLFESARALNVAWKSAEDLQRESLAGNIAFLDDFIRRVEHIYLTLCLDVFAEADAPGVSAPQPLGLTPQEALPLLKYLLQTGKVVGIDIAELSPPHDVANKTARLAANLLAELLDTP